MRKQYVLIAKNIKLTYRLIANEILISNEGDIVIVTDHIPSKSPVLTSEYLDVLCKNYYEQTEGIPMKIIDVLAKELNFGFIHGIYQLIDMKNDRIMYISAKHD